MEESSCHFYSKVVDQPAKSNTIEKIAAVIVLDFGWLCLDVGEKTQLLPPFVRYR
jgi:hypothetical protein